jgi:pimeloyl-ACP methyl ester carboxylesterase
MRDDVNIEAGYVDVRGVRTYFERCGSGQPILCLHTAGRDCRQWQWLMRELASDFLLVSFDFPGHGKSWPLQGNRCIEDPSALCNFIWDFTKTFEMRRPVIAGCSIGGNLSLMMGIKHSTELLAIVPMQGADYTPSISRAALELMQHPHVSMPHFSMAQSMSLLGREASDEVRAFIEWSVYNLSGISFAADLSIYTSIDIRDQMDRVTCPVLMIWGEDDWLVSKTMVDGTISRLVRASRVELVTLPGVGHYAPMENPEAIADSIRRFVADLS